MLANAKMSCLVSSIFFVEPGRLALAISPVEIEVFIEAEICGAGDVAVEAEFFPFEAKVAGACGVAG